MGGQKLSDHMAPQKPARSSGGCRPSVMPATVMPAEVMPVCGIDSCMSCPSGAEKPGGGAADRRCPGAQRAVAQMNLMNWSEQVRVQVVETVLTRDLVAFAGLGADAIIHAPDEIVQQLEEVAGDEADVFFGLVQRVDVAQVSVLPEFQPEIDQVRRGSAVGFFGVGDVADPFETSLVAVQRAEKRGNFGEGTAVGGAGGAIWYSISSVPV